MSFTYMRGAEFSELMTLVAIVEDGSFRGAARRLGVSPSALSHSMRSLEDRLGARLLHRTTRSVSATEAGLELLARLRPAMTEIHGAVRDVAAFQQQPRGLLRINLPRAAAHVVLLPKLGAFRSTYPDIQLDLVIDDAVIDVIAKGFDAGIRSGSMVQQDMISVPLTPDLRMAVVAAPAYLAERPKLRQPSDLHDHECLTYRWKESGLLHPWRFEGPDGPFDVGVRSVLTVNDTELLLSAALQGVGLAQIVESLVTPHIASGALIRVFDDWCEPSSGFHLYFSGRRHMPTALRAFIDFMKWSNT